MITSLLSIAVIKQKQIKAVQLNLQKTAPLYKIIKGVQKCNQNFIEQKHFISLSEKCNFCLLSQINRKIIFRNSALTKVTKLNDSDKSCLEILNNNYCNYLHYIIIENE